MGGGFGRGRSIMATLICFGLGYCAEHFIAEFAGKFERIVGTVRSAERAAILNAYQAGHVRAVVFDGVRATPELNDAIGAADYALVSAAFTVPDRTRLLRSRAAKRGASSSRDRFSIAFTSAISRRRSTPRSRAAPPVCSTLPTTSHRRRPIRSCSQRS